MMSTPLHPHSEFAPPLLSEAHLRDMRTPLEWELPEQLNIGTLICGRWADIQPARTALLHVSDNLHETRWSYGQLDTASRQLATALKSCGIKPADRIALLLPQAPETIISHVASAYCKAITVPLFNLFGTDALAYRLNDSATSIVITDEEGFKKLAQIAPSCPALTTIITLGTHTADTAMYKVEDTPLAIHDFWELTHGHPPLDNVPATHRDEPAIMIYTSGTTGPPKGTLHAHRFLLGHLPNIEISHNGLPQAGDIAWTPADWAWIGGLMDLALPALFYGVPLVSHRMRKFEPEKAFKLIAQYNIRNMFLPPTALKMMKQFADSTPLPKELSIRSIASGGEALPAAITRWAAAELGVFINEIYGQTECNLVICTNRPTQNCTDGFMGMAVAGHELAILDTDGNPLPANHIGQIAVKADHPVTFLNYWQQPEKTAEKFVGEWLLTGDLGLCNPEGQFKFVSRDDDIISSSGYRIGPTEIENCLLSHPMITNAAVIGLHDTLRGEIVSAILVPAREVMQKDDLEKELVHQVKETLSPHMVPRQIFWAEHLPMTTTGKIMRGALRKIYQAKN